MKPFKAYMSDQLLLLSPGLQDWLLEGHLALFTSDVVDGTLGLTPILATYETDDGHGQPPYHPALKGKLFLYVAALEPLPPGVEPGAGEACLSTGGCDTSELLRTPDDAQPTCDYTVVQGRRSILLLRAPLQGCPSGKDAGDDPFSSIRNLSTLLGRSLC